MKGLFVLMTILLLLLLLLLLCIIHQLTKLFYTPISNIFHHYPKTKYAFKETKIVFHWFEADEINSSMVIFHFKFNL